MKQIIKSPIKDEFSLWGRIYKVIKKYPNGTRIYQAFEKDGTALGIIEVIRYLLDPSKSYQIYPSPCQFGKFAWSFIRLDNAIKKAEELEKRFPLESS